MPTLPRLFIDWLGLTIPIEAERREEVQRRLDDADRWGDVLSAQPRRGRYRNRYTLQLPVPHDPRGPQRSKITIQSGATREGANELNVAYSPNNAGEGGRTLLASLLRELIGSDYRSLFYAGNVNRMDITFDVRRISVRDLWIQDSRPRERKSAIIRGADLQTETLYLGYKATREFIVYDKGAERGRLRDAIPWTRIEYRYTKGDHPLRDLFGGLRYPLNGFSIRRYAPLPPPIAPRMSRAIFDALRLRGAGAPNRGEATEHDLSHFVDAFPYWHVWTRRTSIWAQLRDRIDELLPHDD